MKHYVEILNKKKLGITIYILLGIVLALLNSFSASYFQKVLDDFGTNTLSITTLCIYGFVLVIVCGLNYIDEYPSCKLSESIYLGLKLKALRKMSTIDYKDYQSLGTGNLIQKIENGANSGKSIIFDFYFKLFRELIPSIVFSLIFIATIDKNIMIYIGIGYVFVFIVTNILLKYLYNIKAHILNNEENFNKYLIRGFMELVVFRTNKRFKDEISKATNASEELVMKNIMKFLKDKTIITIAHRLNTIKDFDGIFVFKDGKIVGDGHFKELLENNQYFKELWNTALKNS